MPKRVRLLLLAASIPFLVLGLSLSPYASAVSSGFLSTHGTSIIDSHGLRVNLQGVNLPGYECLGANDRHSLQMHTEGTYKHLSKLGFNVVRLPISWQMLEQKPGSFNNWYLTNYVDRDIRWAKAQGMYVVLDMHQWMWAKKWGGCGLPDWAVRKYSTTTAGMQQAINDFWLDGPLQQHLIETWVKVAGYYSNEPTIAGYDLFNEPWINVPGASTSHAIRVGNFYIRAIDAIRKADRNHLIILEPAVLNTYSYPIQRPNIVWSPHFYPLSFSQKYYPENVTVLRADFSRKYDQFVIRFGAPMWIGEFGSTSSDQSYQLWLTDAVKLFNQYDIGYAWWAYDGPAGIPNSIIPSSS